MRKVLFCLSLFALCALSSCSKETTYTFQNIRNWPAGTEETQSNTTFFLEEYDDNGDIVANRGVSFADSKVKQEYTANSHTELIRVKMQISHNSFYAYRWDSQVYYVDEGRNIDIVIDDGTNFVEDRP